MDMELDKKTLTVFEAVLDTSVVHDESCEMIVPDASPDIMRIICAAGAIHIKERTPRDGRLDISGTIKGCVLYLSEGDEIIRRLEVLIPFTHNFDSNSITGDSRVILNAWLQSFEAREVNPRKINVRANVGMTAKVYEKSEINICTGIVQAEEYALELKGEKVGVYAPIAVKDKGFTISDDVELPASRPQLSSIIRSNAELNVTDMKIIGNKAIIKGNAYLTYLYQTKEDELASCEHELPFSQIIDVDEMNEDCRLKVKLTLRGVELEPQHDMSGDTRFISVSILADACVLAYYDGDIEAIVDVYSTKHELTCDFESKAIPGFAEHISKRIALTETIETAGTINSVADLNITLEPAYKRCEEGGEMLVSEGFIELVYRGEDGGMYCTSRRCNAVCPLGEQRDVSYDCTVKVSGKSYSLSGGNEVIVRFFVDYEADAAEIGKTVCIAGVNVDLESDKNSEDTPSVIIKYINADVPLWDTAKRYNTTVREIAAANALDDEETVRAGSMLLIPRAR